MLNDCIRDALNDREHLSEFVLETLGIHIRELVHGHESWLLQPADKREHTDTANEAKSVAVDYIITCRKNGYDDNPKQKVAELYGVNKRTVESWM